jgi:ATP-dependent helicase/nuclease subunit A
MTPRQQAEAAQRTASDPHVSAFVAASAGSGKTKLLTDRVLRLLLEGAAPERIQCLTFTKAAAAEMALRLQGKLSEYVVAADADLDGKLGELGIAIDAATRRRARALFAQVLDQPGGMRVGTLHAFCQSLLRRFPLEAEISPHFALIEDHDADEMLREARETLLATTPHLDAVEAIAGICMLAEFSEQVAVLQAQRDRIASQDPAAIAAAQRRALGVTAGSEEELMAAAINWQAEPALRDAAVIVAERGSPAMARQAARMLDWLQRDDAGRILGWGEWRGLFLKSDGGSLAASKFVNQKLQDKNPGLVAPFLAEAARVIDCNDRIAAWGVARLSAALVTLAHPVLADYRGRKDRAGRLDYDDLIARAARLLHDPGAAWVLYKLDGGLDHLLLDEVQDTSPAQWALAHALTDEFFAGSGARETALPRTVFAVGDRKQSIFSFQGADAAGFDRHGARLGQRVTAAGAAWREVSLEVSFRSTAPVLALVDAVFAQPDAAAGVVPPGQTLHHVADRADHAGRVELWPLTPRPAIDTPPPWSVASENRAEISAPERLARHLAAWIRGQTDGSVALESRGRPLRPGDIMVLVRSRARGGFAASLLRRLKALGVPVAGLDRMTLAEQPAVADLLGLCDALLLPEDDLNLACVLRSPLGDISEDDLADLAIGRPGTLWQALRRRASERPAWQAAHDFLAGLLGRVDHAPPHALLSDALGAGGGRARLLRRLGPEAGEPVDELLAAALRYQSAHPPSLQGFVHWLRRSGIEAKREPEGNAPGSADSPGMVRIMTVHGAKGLQAPLVILPDTTQPTPDRGAVFWGTDPASREPVPLYAPRKALRCQAVDRIEASLKAARTEEENRLLYVALTRAEDRLLVCGWVPGRTGAAPSWYDAIAGGLSTLAAEEVPFDAWDGMCRRVTSPQRIPAPSVPAAKAKPAARLPDWAGAAPHWRPAPPPPEADRPTRLAPSRPQDAGLGPVPQAASPLAQRDAEPARFRRGQLIHTLLQHLPALAPDRRTAACRRYLAREPDAATITAEVLGILGHPDLAPLFGAASRAEVPLTGVVGDQVIGGLVDRLAVLPDRVLLADYKTNRAPPADPAATPVLYLRQLAAYRALLRAIHPGRPVICALIWTRAARVDLLDDALLAQHAPDRAA